VYLLSATLLSPTGTTLCLLLLLLLSYLAQPPDLSLGCAAPTVTFCLEVSDTACLAWLAVGPQCMPLHQCGRRLWDTQGGCQPVAVALLWTVLQQSPMYISVPPPRPCQVPAKLPRLFCCCNVICHACSAGDKYIFTVDEGRRRHCCRRHQFNL